MLTGDIRSQINAVWDSFWAGGISNPLEGMEHITYLLLRRLDKLKTAHRAALTELDALFASFQHRAFRGEL